MDFGYDQRGRLQTVAQSPVTTTLSYNNANELTGESYASADGKWNGIATSSGYNTLLQRISFELAGIGTPLNYTFKNSAGRLTNVSEGTYSSGWKYLAYSPQMDEIIFQQGSVTKMTTRKQFDRLNRLVQTKSGTGTPPVWKPELTYQYQYNAANQRIRVTQGSGQFWDYGYDRLGQVKAGRRYWADGTEVAGQQYGYAYDDIGNRTETSRGAGSTPANYTPNALNQYSQRTNPGRVDTVGLAELANTVTVNEQAVSRRGEYFHHALAVDNGNAQWASVDVKALNNGVIADRQTGYVPVPKSAETFVCDTDGNLTEDSLWHYQWNAENRLVGVESKLTPPTATMAKWLSFAYDWRGRRIRKTAYRVGDGNNDVMILDRLFVYDGWNLVAELNAADKTPILTYVWGNDLSGTPQGAGGVGGLVLIKVHVGVEAGTYFPCYDGNGNVVALMNAADGSIAAVYEYGPFGELIRATGPMARINPFRFSTKYQDDETGLIYYGFRYYSPSLGRWLSRDPIEEEGGANIINMLDNDTINNIDVNGLNKSTIKELPKRKYDNSCCNSKKIAQTKKILMYRYITAERYLEDNNVPRKIQPPTDFSCANLNSSVLNFMKPIPPCWTCELVNRETDRILINRDHWIIICTSHPIEGEGAQETISFDYWGGKPAGIDPKWFYDAYKKTGEDPYFAHAIDCNPDPKVFLPQPMDYNELAKWKWTYKDTLKTQFALKRILFPVIPW